MITDQVAHIDDDAVADSAETSDEAEATAVESVAEPEVGRRRRVVRSRRGVVTVLIALLLLSGAGAAVWQYAVQYRTDVATDSEVADTVIDAAHQGAVALLTYAPQTLDRDFATAKSHLTGDFLAYYNEFSEQVVRPAATDKKVKTTAEVTRAALNELHPTSAKVLVYLNQATTSTDKPDPALTTSAVLVSLDKHGNDWLISGFDPV